MDEKELAKFLAKIEVDFKTNIERLILEGRSESYIAERCQREALKRIKNAPELEGYLGDIMASIRRWIKVSLPIWGYLNIAHELRKRTRIWHDGGTAFHIKLNPGQYTGPPLSFDKFKKTMDYLNSVEEITLGAPSIPNFRNVLKDTIRKLSSDPLTGQTAAAGKRLELYTKVELDLRHKSQEDMLVEARQSGQDLYWISSHTDCSKRCARWQSKLVSISLPAINSRFETGRKADGNIIYSLDAIINQTDKYGYHNNVIVGFNCRHRLIPWQSKSHPPAHYKSKQIDNYQQLVAKQRRMERKIRQEKVRLEATNLVDRKEAKKIRAKLKQLKDAYRSFVDQCGLVNEDWRFKF